MSIIVEDSSDKGIATKAIENQVKLRLLQAGIKVGDKEVLAAYFYINAKALDNNIVLNIHAKRIMTFEANGKTYKTVGSVWNTGGTLGKLRLRSAIDQCIDEFLLDYLKANPKKKED